MTWGLVAVAMAAGCSRPNPAYFVESPFDSDTSTVDGTGGGSGTGGTGGIARDGGGVDQVGGSTFDAGPVAPDTQPAMDVGGLDTTPPADLRPADAAPIDPPRDAAPPDVAPDLAPLPVGNGLELDFWDGTQLEDGTGSGFDRTWTGQSVNFDWGTASPTGDGTFDNDHFSLRFRGSILPAYTETYTFIAESDEGVRLWINDMPVLESWTAVGFSTRTGTIRLTGRVKHKFLMEYREVTGSASVKLFWSSPSLGPKQLVPKAALFFP